MVQKERGDLSPTLGALMAEKQKEAMERGIERGLETGLLKGEEGSKKKLALTLLREGFEVDYVAQLTNLSAAEVEKLRETLM